MLTSASSCKTMRVIWAPCRITPACAGNSSIGLARLSPAANHPRLRGEQFNRDMTCRGFQGSPPLARGTGISRPDMDVADRITPACAGNSGDKIFAILLIRDHPRLRGEQLPQTVDRWRWEGSPPLARGTVPLPTYTPTCPRITPACAGNSGLGGGGVCFSRDHPRLRGEQRGIRRASRTS